MSSIDDRIVQLQLDNDQFEKATRQTNDSLDSLKDHLQLTGGTDGLTDVQKAADGVNLSGIESSLTKISGAFSAMGVIGINVLSRLTQSAIDLGAKAVSAVVDPILTGGKARALALEQAKFQFRGLGLDIDATMASAKAAVLGTAFGLQDAATAAAQFGASGITAGHGLDQALRGISGVAAQTGSSYADIANVFTKVAGQGRLMGDDLLSMSARGVNAAAILGKALGKSEADVRKMVTDGKIDFTTFANVMNDTFGANAAKASETFSGALSNMKAAMSRIGADIFTPLDEAERKVFLGMTAVFDNAHAAILPLINAFGELANFVSDMISPALTNMKFDFLTNIASVAPIVEDGLKNIYYFVSGLARTIGQGFSEIFPAPTVDQIKGIATAFQSFTQGLLLNSDTLDKIKSTAKGLFAILDLGIQIVMAVVKGIFELLGIATEGSGSILDFTANVGDWLVKLDQAAKTADVFNKVVGKIVDFLKAPIKFIKALVVTVADAIGVFAHFSGDALMAFLGRVKDRLEGVGGALTAVINFFKFIGNAISGWYESIFHPKIAADAGKSKGDNPVLAFFQNIVDGIKNIKFSDVTDAVNSGIIAALGISIIAFIAKAKGLVGGILPQLKDVGKQITGALNSGFGLKNFFAPIIDGVTKTFKSMQEQLRSKTLINIAIAIALITASVIALSFVDSQRLAVALGAITAMFANMAVIMKALTSMKAFESGKIIAVGAALILVSIAIDLLTIAVTALAKLDWVELARGIAGVTALMGVMIASMALLTKIPAAELIAVSAAMLILSVALNGMAKVVVTLGQLTWEEIARGMGAFIVILGSLIATTKLMEKDSLKLLVTAKALSTLAFAMFILAGVVKDLGALPMNEIVKGLVGLAAMMTILVVAVNALEANEKGLIFTTIALLGLAVAIKIMADSVAKLGALKPEAMAQGLLGIAALLLAVTIAMNTMDASIGGALAMVIAAAAILVLAEALKIVAKMSWDDIGRTMVVLAGSLIILALAAYAFEGAALGAVAMLLVAAAVIGLALAFKVFSTLSWDDIGRILTILAAGLGIIAVLGIALIPASVGFLLLGVAILLLGTGVYLAATGIALLAGAIGLLVAVGAAGIALMTSGIQAFIGLLPSLGIGIAEAFVSFAVTIGQQAGTLIVAFVQLITAMLSAIDQVVPEIINTATTLIVALVNALVILLPLLVNAGLTILNGILNGIANHIQDTVKAGLLIITNFINGVAQGIPSLLQAGANLVLSFMNGIADTIRNNRQQFVNAALNIADAITGGLSTGLLNGVNKVISAVKSLVSHIPQAIKDILGIHSPSKVTTELGEFTALGLSAGFDNKSDVVAASAEAMASNAVDSVTSTLSAISDAVNSNVDMTPSIQPVLDLSAIKKDASQIGQLLGTDKTLSVVGATNAAISANGGFEQNMRVRTDADGEQVKGGDTIINQTNNSPKAISAIDSYRNTKSALALAKGAGDNN